MLFVDFPDLQSNDSTTALYDRFVPQARSWYNEVSYGRAQLDVTPLNRWVRMPRSLASYGLRDGISWPEHHDYMADAIAAADPSFDFSAYQVVYVVAPRGTGVDRSPAFQAYPGSGIRVDGTEIRYGATYFDDTRSDARYAANVFIHETGHILGLPDLYDFSHSGSWSADLFRFAGSWDTMSWNEQGGHFLAWEKWKLGWLDASQLTCLGGPGELTTTVTLLERTGGLKAIVVPTGLSSAYVIEARKRIGEDARLCEDGVLIYTVNAAIRSGSGPIQVQAAQRDNTSGDAFSRCGPLYNAPFDSARGEVATFTDNTAGLTVQVLSSSATGYRVHVTRTSYAPQGGPAQVANGSQSVQSQETNFAPPQGLFSTISLPFGLGWDLAPLEAG
jgi:M6 family metalloprotease-like protein